MHDCMCGHRVHQGHSELPSGHQDVAATCAAHAPMIRRSRIMTMFPFSINSNQKSCSFNRSANTRLLVLCSSCSCSSPHRRRCRPTDLSHTKNLYLMMYFLLSFLSMHDTCMFVELLNNTFPLFINNVFQCCKIILKYFCSPVHVARAQILVLYNTHITQFYIKHEVFY
jgi:hypothetical protein